MKTLALALGLAAVAGACSSRTEPEAAEPPRLRGDVSPVTRADEAKPRTAIPPFVDCRAPRDGEPAGARDGKVCTPVSIAGCTEQGRAFADYGDCAVVRTQRPYWPAAAARSPDPSDARLQDAAFMRELAWVTEQARASGCTCCHEAKLAPQGPSQWYIDAAPIWTTTVSDSGIALFAGLADSSVLGAYAPEDNNGFQRSTTGLPSTDGPRMRAFWLAELRHRGISEEQAAATPPFGGPIYTAQKQKPGACGEDEGIDAEGLVTWNPAAPARYVYVLASGSANPGVPPNLDTPAGTLWRLDVLAREEAIGPGLRYGTTPPGTFQAVPAAGSAPRLEPGVTYQLVVLRDIGFPAKNCLFTAK